MKIKTARDATILVLGAGGFISQIAWQFLGHEPNWLILSASLTCLGLVPLLRLDEWIQIKESNKSTSGPKADENGA